jgi:hypothetical protein
MKIRPRWLLLVASAAGLTGCAASAPQVDENPYPYGKAEFQGKAEKDVLRLIGTADKYRGLCARGYSSGWGLAVLEHYGREAKNWYREVLDREPSNAYATLCMGYVDLILGRAAVGEEAKENHYAAATSRLREALENRPGYARAYLYLAQVQALRELYAEAEKNLRILLNSNIEDSEIHAWMAYVLLKTDRASLAQTHLARAIELDDPSADARWSRMNRRRY